MASRSSSSKAPRQRQSRRIHERSRIALFDVFRHAFEENDSSATAKSSTEADGLNTISEISGRSNARRIGVDEETLRQHVRVHLATLMNTIRLDAAVDLSEAPHVASSILNYGFQDLSNLTRKELTSHNIEQSIKDSLSRHEPRLLKESIHVRVGLLESENSQRVEVHVTADLIADPADIPVEFNADVDMGAGKVVLNSARL
ncbi:type VI secretion system baseplate subunit TssE [Nereida sp. MMG025]|uniref:type VI secretion system baseplate subunit TssE n=1 Tax=Nereida sp. MMG025 TaxID=2909981 RepID=UPI001F014B56|nr:type VI secretion system baseplate subunit TssE [Nereida sp. MMG025]MCF6445710.1 type VI secretion system baseplate subunit TssE [Nereida sp. MMG025]